MNSTPFPNGPIFGQNHSINLYYLNGLYQNVASEISSDLTDYFKVPISVSSGIWGGTYLIADASGNSLRRIWRLYCIVNLPQNTPLDQHSNLERFVGMYCSKLCQAFEPHGLKLELRMWGGQLPFSNRTRPNLTIHMEDETETVRWLRPILVWNEASWEESILYDTIRLVKELKQNLDLSKGPTLTDPQEMKYMMQDVIITYKTLGNIHSDDFNEHAQPVVDEMTKQFMSGLHDSLKIRDLYHWVLESALVYGYEESLQAVYQPEGLDISDFENWPVEKINWVPQVMCDKLIPPIESIFAGFKKNLDSVSG